jgi:glucose/arabinose dehydrogenase
VLRPEKRAASEALIGTLSVKSGFALNVFAPSLGNTRMLATHGDYVYATRTMEGDVLRLTDSDANGVADATDPVATDLADVHGIAFNGDQVYLATIHSVYRGTVNGSGGFDALTPIITDLPDGGQHYRRTLGVGPDSLLYISVGSTCDACPDPNPENATILRASLDGTNRVVFASGLRNTIGFDWHPDTGDLWGMDQGSDMRGDDLPPEELNRISEDANYGWPYCFGDRVEDPIIDDPPGSTKQAFCAASQPAVAGFPAHQAPIGMVFYTGTSFPESYRDDAFVAFHGSWNRDPATGYKVVRVLFEDGEPQATEDLVTGFLIEDGTAYFGRPAGITTAPDGALLFSDDENGFIYRITAAP